MKNKYGANIWMIVGILALGFIGWSVLSGSGGAPVLSVTDSDSGAASLGACAVEDTTLTLRGFDVENKGTAVGAGELHSIWINGDYAGTVADAATTTVSPGDEVVVLFSGNNSEARNGFYPKKVTETIPCVGTKTISAFEMDKNSSAVSLVYLNSDDEASNFGGDTQVIGSGGEETGILKLQGSADDYFGNDHVVIVLEGTNSVYENLEVVGAKRVSAPAGYNPAANARGWAYEIDGLVGSKRVNLDVLIKAKSGQNPAVTNNVTAYVYDSSLFIDADTNEIAGPAVEDELGNDLGANQGRLVIGIS